MSNNPSFVLTDNGLPRTFYHGTPVSFSEFEDSYRGTNTGMENAILGFFFTDNVDVAKTFSGDEGFVIAVHLRMTKTLDLRTQSIFSKEDQASLIYQVMSGEALSPSSALEALNEEVGLGEIDDLKNALYEEEARLMMINEGYDSVVSDLGNGHVEYVVFNPEQIFIVCFQ